jgi:hypothetical protein
MPAQDHRLNFLFTDLADVGPEHESEQVLSVNSLFLAPWLFLLLFGTARLRSIGASITLGTARRWDAQREVWGPPVPPAAYCAARRTRFCAAIPLGFGVASSMSETAREAAGIVLTPAD